MPESTRQQTTVVQLGPSPKRKLEGKRFGPKHNTKFALSHPPPPPPTTHHKLFYQLQETHTVENQFIILILTKKGIAIKNPPPPPNFLIFGLKIKVSKSS